MNTAAKFEQNWTNTVLLQSAIILPEQVGLVMITDNKLTKKKKKLTKKAKHSRLSSVTVENIKY